MATIERDVRIECGSSEDLNDAMVVMEAAFGKHFGEAWTRSQLAGILPMGGVSLILAKAHAREGTVGFSLFRTVADESELLLLAVLPDFRRQGVGTQLLDDFLERLRNDGVARPSRSPRRQPRGSMYRASGFYRLTTRKKHHASDGKRFDAITPRQLCCFWLVHFNADCATAMASVFASACAEITAPLLGGNFQCLNGKEDTPSRSPPTSLPPTSVIIASRSMTYQSYSERTRSLVRNLRQWCGRGAET
jgi:ribosomal-protein-alanine N-acetyltransferase